jgi:hypothetical protein
MLVTIVCDRSGPAIPDLLPPFSTTFDAFSLQKDDSVRSITNVRFGRPQRTVPITSLVHDSGGQIAPVLSGRRKIKDLL